ncbi:MAG TPA: hypothetical protein VHI13_03670 [Candidatus Kapabacteria bacterium]|nr:hypothetical protein [Candidatus Kapabacteria bacterium]
MRIGPIVPLTLASVLLGCGTTGPGSYSGRFGFIMSCQQYLVDRSAGSYHASRATVDLHNRDSANTVEGGDVVVRGDTLERRLSSATGPYYYGEENTGASPYAHSDGNWHVVQIGGSPLFPAITDSIQALPESVAFIGMHAGDTIHRARTTTLHWSRATSYSDSVYLGIYNDAGIGMYISVPDAESAQLAPLNLNRTVPGRAYLTISRIRRRISAGPNGMINEMSYESIHDIEIVIAQ